MFLCRFGRILDYLRYGVFTRIAHLFRSYTFLNAFGRTLGVPISLGSAASSWQEKLQPNVLIIRSDGLGDLTLSLPFLHELRVNLPKARITLLVAKPWRPLAQRIKAIDEVLGNPNSWSRWGAIANVARSAWFGFFTLRPKRFDVVICPRWDADLADDFLLAFFSFAPNRVSFSETSTVWRQGACRGRDRFFTQIVTNSGVKHEAERSLALLLALDLKQAPKTAQGDVAFFKERPKPNLDFTLAPKSLPIGLFPVVELELKQWPIESFIESARQIAWQRTVTFLVFGTTNQLSVCRRFCEELGPAAINLCGRVKLAELPAYLAACRVVLSGDSGGAHLAGILNRPTLVLFRTLSRSDRDQLGSPVRFRPLGANVTVLQPRPSGASTRPIGDISPEEVTAKMLEIIDNLPPTDP